MMIDGKRFEAALQINEVELNFYTIDAMKQQYGRRLVTDMITSVRAHQTNEWANYGGQNSSELIRDRHLVECVCPALHCHRRSPPPSPTQLIPLYPRRSSPPPHLVMPTTPAARASRSSQSQSRSLLPGGATSGAARPVHEFASGAADQRIRMRTPPVGDKHLVEYLARRAPGDGFDWIPAAELIGWPPRDRLAYWQPDSAEVAAVEKLRKAQRELYGEYETSTLHFNASGDLVQARTPPHRPARRTHQTAHAHDHPHLLHCRPTLPTRSTRAASAGAAARTSSCPSGATLGLCPVPSSIAPVIAFGRAYSRHRAKNPCSSRNLIQSPGSAVTGARRRVSHPRCANPPHPPPSAPGRAPIASW